MEPTNLIEMQRQRCDQRCRQQGDTVLSSVTVTHDHLPAVEFRICHPQTQRLHETQTAPVKQTADQPGATLEVRQAGPTKSAPDYISIGENNSLQNPGLRHATVTVVPISPASILFLSAVGV